VFTGVQAGFLKETQCFHCALGTESEIRGSGGQTPATQDAQVQFQGSQCAI